MLAEYKKKTNIGIAFGLLAQLIGFFIFKDKVIGVILAWGGVALFIWGTYNYAKGKGYHGAVGFLGLLSFAGLIVLICLPDKHKDLEKKVISAIKSIVFLLVDMFLLLLFSLIAKGFEGVLLDLEPLPVITKIAMNSPYFFIVMGVALVAKEFLKDKEKTFLINIGTLIGLMIAVLPFLVIGLFLPMYQMAQLLK